MLVRREAFLLIPAGLFSLIVFVTPGCGPGPYIPNAQERWVRDELRAGRRADLGEQYKREPKKQVLKGEFIEALFWEEMILPKAKPRRTRIEIKSARIAKVEGREVTNLDNVEIPHEVIFTDCKFEGPLSGRRSTWRKGLTLDGCVLQGVDFEGAEFGNTLEARNTTFQGPVSLKLAKCDLGLSVSDCEFRDQNGGLDCGSMVVTGDAVLTNVKMIGPVSFRRSKITGTVEFIQAEFPRSLDLGGMDYGGIETDYGGAGWYAPIRLLNQAQYDQDSYTKLDKYLARVGNARGATKAYIAYKRRERGEQLSWGAWLWSAFLDWTVGYGRQPEWVIPWSVLLLLIGTLVFRPRWMVPKAQAGLPRLEYCAFWYSLDLFIPVINLHMKGDWIPSEFSPLGVRVYMVLHVLFGWILVTIGLLALTGFIR